MKFIHWSHIYWDIPFNDDENVVLHNENNWDHKGSPLLINGGLAIISNPFNMQEIDVRYVCPLTLNGFYQNVQLENVNELTLDDVADAAYPAINSNYYEPEYAASISAESEDEETDLLSKLHKYNSPIKR